MSIKLYDEALLTKLKRWIPGTAVQITGVEETRRLFEIISDNTSDATIKLPIIALRRPGGYTLQNTSKRSLTYDGAKMVLSDQAGAKLNVVPISIDYQIDIYTRYLDEADEYARNFIFNLINYPKFTIEIPYENLGLQHDANIQISPEIKDNSDIPERLIPGQFTRFTINLSVPDAYLFDVRIKNNISIVELQVRSNDDSIIEIIDYKN